MWRLDQNRERERDGGMEGGRERLKAREPVKKLLN